VTACGPRAAVPATESRAQTFIMALTPLKIAAQLEGEVHEHFGDREPSPAELQQYLDEKIKAVVDSVTITLAIAAASLVVNVAGLILNSWWIYVQAHRPRCPTHGCGLPSKGKNSEGKNYCANGHTW